MKAFRTQYPGVAYLAAMMLLLAGCATKPDAPTATPSLVPFPVESPTACAREEVIPKIEEIRPEEIKPGTEVTVIASGGFFKDKCGGYDESARVYQVYFDDEPIADLQCYVNHCEGKFVMPAGTAPGRHCLGVQKGTCQMELDVVAG